MLVLAQVAVRYGDAEGRVADSGLLRHGFLAVHNSTLAANGAAWLNLRALHSSTTTTASATTPTGLASSPSRLLVQDVAIVDSPSGVDAQGGWAGGRFSSPRFAAVVRGQRCGGTAPGEAAVSSLRWWVRQQQQKQKQQQRGAMAEGEHHSSGITIDSLLPVHFRDAVAVHLPEQGTVPAQLVWREAEPASFAVQRFCHRWHCVGGSDAALQDTITSLAQPTSLQLPPQAMAPVDTTASCIASSDSGGAQMHVLILWEAFPQWLRADLMAVLRDEASLTAATGTRHIAVQDAWDVHSLENDADTSKPRR